MAKTEVVYSCGHKGVVELLGKSADRERKLAWYQASGLCPECYKAAQHTKQEATPLSVVVTCDPYTQSIILYFEGNTMPVKEQIKAAGYRWGDIPSFGAFGALDMRRPPMAWHKMLKVDEIEAELKDLSESDLKPLVKNNITEMDMMAFNKVKEKYDEKQAKIDAIPKPAVPEKLAGKKWNRTVYGKSGNYAVYLNGEKVTLTDAEAEEIKAYVIAKEAYQKAVAEIQ